MIYLEALQLKCPNCGGAVTLDPKSGRFTCDFCSSDFSSEEVSGQNKTSSDSTDKTASSPQSEYKCPVCGGKAVLNNESGLYVCDFCTSDFTEEELTEDNDTLSDEPQNSVFAEHTQLYVCGSCGAEIVCDENTAATFCHYCHGPVALKGRVEGALTPELIIPFKIDRDFAEDLFKKWCGKKVFVPNSFRSEATLEKMVGLYVPYWLADCKVNAAADYDARKINRYSRGDTHYTETYYYHVSRAAKMKYAGIPADGSKKLDDKLMDSIEPFDYDFAVPFDMSWFSGFYADKYDVDKAAVAPRIKARLEQGVKKLLSDSVTGYSTSVCKNFNLRLTSTKWHYAMLPVWFMTYIYNGKKYFFAVNGQTGKVSGVLPLSVAKLGIMTLGITAASVIFTLLSFYM